MLCEFPAWGAPVGSAHPRPHPQLALLFYILTFGGCRFNGLTLHLGELGRLWRAGWGGRALGLGGDRVMNGTVNLREDPDPPFCARRRIVCISQSSAISTAPGECDRLSVGSTPTKHNWSDRPAPQQPGSMTNVPAREERTSWCSYPQQSQDLTDTC